MKSNISSEKPALFTGRFPDLIPAVGVFLLFLATAAFLNIPTPEPLNLSFGWEYGNIAEALVQGRGFANAFTPGSGPTAWMPPLFVFILAGIFRVFGIKTIASMWALFVLKYAALAVCLVILLSTADRMGLRKHRYVTAILYLGLIYWNLGTFFRSLHDEWLILFLICSALYMVVTEVTRPSLLNRTLLLILASILPLVNPILAAAFLLTAAGAALLQNPGSSSKKSQAMKIFALFVLLGTSTLAWTYRNYQALGTWIPIKSNFWFDFYQANVMDEDGLTTNATFEMFHPIHTNAVQEEYLTEKETRFTEKYKTLSLDWISSHPEQLLQNIGRRAVSALLYMHQSDDILPANHELLLSGEALKLREANLASANDPPFVNWTSLTMPEAEFRRKLQPLNLANESAVIQDWSHQRAVLMGRFGEMKLIARSLVMSLVPFLCLIIGLFVERIRKNPVFPFSAALYLTYLIPYILVSHYRRYQVPLIGVQTIFIFLVVCLILDGFTVWLKPLQKLVPLKQNN